MIFKYFIIGLIQGLTEFLPVSSSGHILIFSKIFNIKCDVILLSVVAHLGSLLAVLICMRKKIFPLIKKPFNTTNLNLIISTIPAVLFVVLFKELVDRLYGMQFVLYGFLITGILLIISDMKNPKNKTITRKNVLFMGLMQGVAILPGISRSGSTMAIGILTGAEKETACEYSFLMSIPVIIGSAIWEMLGLLGEAVEVNFLPLVVAFLSSFVFAILSIKFMMKIVKTNKLYVFSIYTIFLSVVLFFIIF